MSEDTHFFVVDPYFFIYPADENFPLDKKLAGQFIQRLSDWAKILKNPLYEIGMSKDCVEMLKHHPRSILNGKFASELFNYIKGFFAQVSQVIVPIISTIKQKLAFNQALKTIDSEKLIYEITSVTIAPLEFTTRLPEYFQSNFQKMLADLTFARAQKFFPIASFERVSFLTQIYQQDDWLLPSLITAVQASYEADVDSIDSEIPGLIQDEFEIASDVVSFQEMQQKRRVSSLKNIVERVTKKYPNDVGISQELRNIVKKTEDALANASTIEAAIEGLRYWLIVFREKRKQCYSVPQAYELAREAYRALLSHDITDESETVKNDPNLSNERHIRFEGRDAYAFLHIKTIPRIHFAVVERNNDYMVVLGVIDQHLGTAKF
jgi:hypothetical protein